MLLPSTSAFLFGVSRLSDPRPQGPGQSLGGNVFESSFGHEFRREGVTEPVSLPWRCAGEVTAVCRHLNAIFFLLLSMSKNLIRKTAGKGKNRSVWTLCASCEQQGENMKASLLKNSSQKVKWIKVYLFFMMLAEVVFFFFYQLPTTVNCEDRSGYDFITWSWDPVLKRETVSKSSFQTCIILVPILLKRCIFLNGHTANMRPWSIARN